MQINQLPAAASLNLLDKFAVDATDGVTKSITAQALRDLIRTNSYGAPLEASTVTAMTDTSKVYVYTGNETGYTNGNWYYYNGTAWVSGGAYNSVAVNTDTTLTLSGVAADARATGTAIQGVATQVTSVEGDLQQEIDNIFSDLATAYEALTFPVSEGQYCVRAERVYKANQDIPTPEAWNSSHWTLTSLGEGLSDLGNVQGDITTLNAAIVTERLARQTADTSLNNAISAEATAREQAVAAEASAREAADTALNNAVSAEATAREAADNDIKSTLYPPNEGIISVAQSQIIQGSYNSSGAVVASDSRIRTSGYIAVYSGEKIKFSPGTNIKQMYYGKFDQDKHFISSGIWSTGGIIDINWDGYIIMQWRKSANNENITPSDYDAQTAFVTNIYERIDELESLVGEKNVLPQTTDLNTVVGRGVHSLYELNQDRYPNHPVEMNGKPATLIVEYGTNTFPVQILIGTAGYENRIFIRSSIDGGTTWRPWKSLYSDITAEASAREAADTLLNNAISAEASARNAADTALSRDISAEATARVAADNEIKSALQGNNGLGCLALPGTYTDGAVLFTATDLGPGNRIWYDFTTTERAAYISFKDADGASLRSIGKTTSSGGATSYSGYYDLPSTFSYAVVGTGTNGALTLKYLYFQQHPKRLLQSLSDMKSNINVATSGAAYNADEGVQFLSSAFIHGDVDNSGVYLEQMYKVMTQDAINIVQPTTVCVSNGFRVKPLLYSKTTGAFVSAGEWQTSDFVITSYARAYKFVICRVESDLDENEVADIVVFAKKAFILNVVKQQVTLTRRGRFLDRWSLDGETSQRLLSQCATYDSANNVFYTCGSRNQNTEQTINVWQGQTHIKTVYRTDLGHGSDITKVDDYLVIATSGNTIPVLDATDPDFATVARIDASAIAYKVHGVSTNFPSNTVYFVGIDVEDHDRLVIGTLDIANRTAIKLFTVANPNGTPQGITAYGNCLYLLYIQSDAIYRLNLDFEQITGVYMMEDISGIFPVGEPETLLKIGSRIVLFSACWYRKIENEMFVSMAQIFDTDIVGKNIYNEKMNYMFPLEKISITVNGEGNTYFNPYDEFNTIEEACYVLNRYEQGIITARNLAPGDCVLVGGNYTIKAYEGTENLVAMTVVNSVVIVVDMEIDQLVMENSVVYLINSTANSVNSDCSVLINQSP